MPVEKQNRVVDTDNIQGSIWPRLPKFYESYLFFKITDADKFRKDLRSLVDNNEITTGTQCEKHLENINEFEEACAHSRRHVPEPIRKPFVAVNIAFTHPGLLKVEHPSVELEMSNIKKEDPDAYCKDRINDGLFEKGMFDDLVYEGADNPPALDPNFRAPIGNETKEGLERWEWRVDGVFIVAAHSAKALKEKIGNLESYFDIGDSNQSSANIAFRKDGQVRPGAKRGKEHFDYHDHISQPKIKGLDDPPLKGEPHACPPGYIFLGHEGDPNKKRGPAWAKEGSFLVFRQLDQKVPELEQFLKREAPKIPGSNYSGENGPEKLGAHLMGRWKSGAPVANAVDCDNPELAFDNKFDFRPKKSIKGCPFAAHVRKMRPRADKKRDVGTEDDGCTDPVPEPESDESEAEGQKEDASVILRRGITFGPELTKEEKEQGKTLEHRGMYFTCYQSLIRDGFNFLMTRWASNSSFPEYKVKTFPDGPGMDPFVNQRLRSDHPEGHISLYDGWNQDRTVKLNLGISPWVDQRGGEYFFTPSIRALRDNFSAPREAWPTFEVGSSSQPIDFDYANIRTVKPRLGRCEGHNFQPHELKNMFGIDESKFASLPSRMIVPVLEGGHYMEHWYNTIGSIFVVEPVAWIPRVFKDRTMPRNKFEAESNDNVVMKANQKFDNRIEASVHIDATRSSVKPSFGVSAQRHSKESTKFSWVVPKKIDGENSDEAVTEFCVAPILRCKLVRKQKVYWSTNDKSTELKWSPESYNKGYWQDRYVDPKRFSDETKKLEIHPVPIEGQGLGNKLYLLCLPNASPDTETQYQTLLSRQGWAGWYLYDEPWEEVDEEQWDILAPTNNAAFRPVATWK